MRPGSNVAGSAIADAAVLWNLSDAAFALSNFAAATFVLALALGLLEQRLAPDWIGWAGSGLAAFLVLDGALQVVSSVDDVDVLGTVAFVAFLIWVFVVSTVLARTPAVAEPNRA